MLQQGGQVIARFAVIQPGGGGDDAQPGDQGDPQGNKACVDLPASEDDIPVGIAHGHDGKNGFHRRVFLGAGQQAGDAHVRRAVHADAAIAPGLYLDVLQQLTDIVLVNLAECLPAAFRCPGAAQIHNDVGVPSFHQRRVGGTDGAERLVVTGKGCNHRERAVDGIAVFVRWQGDGGGQANTVAHGDQLLGQVDSVRVFLVALVGLAPGQVHRCAFLLASIVIGIVTAVAARVGVGAVGCIGNGRGAAATPAAGGQLQCQAKENDDQSAAIQAR